MRKSNNRRYTAEEIQQIMDRVIEAVNSGESITSFGRRNGIPNTTLLQCMKKHRPEYRDYKAKPGFVQVEPQKAIECTPQEIEIEYLGAILRVEEPHLETILRAIKNVAVSG